MFVFLIKALTDPHMAFGVMHFNSLLIYSHFLKFLLCMCTSFLLLCSLLWNKLHVCPVDYDYLTSFI